MTLETIHGGAADIEEPNWSELIPDKGKSAAGCNATWREYAHREWLRVTAELREAGTLSPANKQEIKRLIIAYVRYDRAAAEFFRVGLITKAPRTGVAMVNIIQTEMRQADADATTHESELGVSPRRRGAVAKAKAKEKRQSAADAYLQRVK
jgi:P27 family predicted phage terminase small subunit